MSSSYSELGEVHTPRESRAEDGVIAHLRTVGRVGTAEPETAVPCTPGPAGTASRKGPQHRKETFVSGSLFGRVDTARVCRSK